MGRVLVVDDDPVELRLLQAIFRHAPGFEVVAAASGAEALAAVVAAPVDLVILDLGLPDLGGMEVLARLKTDRPQLPIIILTGRSDVRTAVDAIQHGADNFLTKPVETDQLVVAARMAIDRSALRHEVSALRGQLGHATPLGKLGGASAAMRKVGEQIRQVASSGFTVLVAGETGTGKELVAQAIHDESRRAGPLVATDCGAIPENLIEAELFGYEKGAFTGAERRKEGYFGLAQGGTLLLDELGNLPHAVQGKLLRVLQERRLQPLGATKSCELDLRVVAATNLSLEAEVAAGRFRQDLYFRLAEFVITLPPLRERREDIPGLVARFQKEASIELRRPVTGIEEPALAALQAHAWPGNVRQLRNVVRQAVLLTSDSTISAAAGGAILPSLSAVVASVAAEETGPPGQSLKEIAAAAVAAAEQQAIRHALKVTEGNKTRAAQLLKVDYKTLYLKLKRYGLEGDA